MEIYRLRSFVAVARCRSITRAAGQLAAADALLADAREHAGQIAGHVDLAVINDAETLGLVTITPRMRAKYPDLTVLIRHGLSGWALGEVKNGRSDAGFFIGPLTDPEVSAMPVRQIRYCIAAPVAWKAELERDGSAAIGRLPWLWVPASRAGSGRPARGVARFIDSRRSPSLMRSTTAYFQCR